MTSSADYIDKLEKQLAAVTRERDEAMTETLHANLSLATYQRDAERINFLESLTNRTEYINKKLNNSSANSDMHFHGTGCSLYLRNCCGKVVKSGSGSVREAIDAAMKEQRT